MEAKRWKDYFQDSKGKSFVDFRTFLEVGENCDDRENSQMKNVVRKEIIVALQYAWGVFQVFFSCGVDYLSLIKIFLMESKTQLLNSKISNWLQKTHKLRNLQN